MTVKVVRTKEELPPWSRGPFELINHADGHRKEQGDTDRRIALIGFDNAIEVCIDVFIKLHPRLRRGVELGRDAVAKATQNYHSKIEWLEKYAEEQQLTLGFSVNEIVWYHSLRNQLYHSGNGMVPEAYVLDESRIAALAVFETLFEVDVAPLLGGNPVSTPLPTERILQSVQNSEMELLRLYIEFERTLERLLHSVSGKSEGRPRTSASTMWREYIALAPTSPRWDEIVKRTTNIRGSVVHGHSEARSHEEILAACRSLTEIIEYLQKQAATK